MWDASERESTRTGGALRTLRLLGKGLSDTFEHLLPFAVFSVLWWIGVFLVPLAPGATVALFAMTDPRHQTNQPDWRVAFAIARRNLGKGWLLAAVPLPLLLVLAWNLWFYLGRDSRFGVLVPVWFVFLGLTASVLLATFAVAGLSEQPIGETLKQGLGVVMLSPFRWLVLTLIGYLMIALGTVLVVPLIFFVPAMLAAIVNRAVLFGLGIKVFDPLEPTPEREVERASSAKRKSRFGP